MLYGTQFCPRTDMDLVFIRVLTMRPCADTRLYSYASVCSGVDDLPATLGDLHRAGFYI